MPGPDYARQYLEGAKAVIESDGGDSADTIINHTLGQISTQRAMESDYAWSDITHYAVWMNALYSFDQLLLLDGTVAPHGTFKRELLAQCDDLLEQLPLRK
jgi:hypothetical protein